VKTGIISGPDDLNGWINNWGPKKLLYSGEVHVPPNAIDFATAWVLTKTTEPVRLVATIALVPYLARHLPPRVLRAMGARIPDAAAAAAATAAAATASAAAAAPAGAAAAAARSAASAAPAAAAPRRAGMW
jgi:hypothetical protein